MKAVAPTAPIIRKRRLRRASSGKQNTKASSAPRNGAILSTDAVAALLVATATEIEAVWPGLSFRLVGFGVHVAYCGAPVQVMVTLPEKDAPLVMLKSYLAVPPLVVVEVVEEGGAAHATGSIPLPVRATDCGDPGALSTMES